MKKRLRKKKHLHEFRTLGWYVNYQLADNDEGAQAAFWDELIDQVDSLDLLISGSAASFFAQPRQPLAEVVTRDKQQRLQQWLTQKAGVTTVRVSSLTDAWYGPFKA